MKQAVTGAALPPAAGAYSAGIVAEGRLVFVSGQGPLRDGQIVRGTIEEETEIVLDNLRTIVEAAGATLADVVRVGVFLADLGDFAAMNAVYERRFPAPLPARTTVGAQLPGIKVEIDCVAVLPEAAG
jgi:2-iminobutanoate/2-iminopropanoate deaminase